MEIKKKSAEEFAEKLNKDNTQQNVFFVCAPENTGDWIQFQTDLLKQMKDQFSYVKMQEDRGDIYRVYKMIKVYDSDGKLASCDWDNSFEGN